ncbi:HD domain-containing protein [Megalodesulfovibrio gigas]|uniref:HD/PDEase domain-containing protein n=1 Tax=Megalodesulfovibrio gigas (strain ATCC 19364 / DSM 1382 / NCIMB 9332 / VKM B-1759) TaxID=1121448 RepID=T2G9T8_MEGG1|nr:HD domain-containing protein [Megalodesulfovibrio gigas]AGW12891.1 hypothetical protein DGI_1014 [Megalodesulfovibrio gigas DSM 1382 = ATCC 19364]
MEGRCSKLHTLVDAEDPAAVLAEVQLLLDAMAMPEMLPQTAQIYRDVVRLFHGEYPGYRASNTKYHNLEHTSAVLLAAIRLAHGAQAEGLALSARGVGLLMTCALFHDAGLIQTEDDTEGTGAKYTVGHEARSIRMLAEYAAAHNLPEEDARDGAHIIACTIMDKAVAEIPFRTEELAALGRMLGVADLYAQMADRAYLEKLFLLYREFEEAGVAGFDSELMLLEKTEGFYENIVKRRLAEELGSMHRLMRSHFRVRHGLDADPYEEAIRKNIEYLKLVLEETRRIYRERFRRGGIIW